MSAVDEPRLRLLQVCVCENCIAQRPGECHVPGCFYWMHSIADVPAHLAMFVVPDETNHNEMVRLTRWMADHGGYDAEDIAYAVEKPWKFDDELRRSRVHLVDGDAG